MKVKANGDEVRVKEGVSSLATELRCINNRGTVPMDKGFKGHVSIPTQGSMHHINQMKVRKGDWGLL